MIFLNVLYYENHLVSIKWQKTHFAVGNHSGTFIFEMSCCQNQILMDSDPNEQNRFFDNISNFLYFDNIWDFLYVGKNAQRPSYRRLEFLKKSQVQTRAPRSARDCGGLRAAVAPNLALRRPQSDSKCAVNSTII